MPVSGLRLPTSWRGRRAWVLLTGNPGAAWTTSRPELGTDGVSRSFRWLVCPSPRCAVLHPP